MIRQTYYLLFQVRKFAFKLNEFSQKLLALILRDENRKNRALEVQQYALEDKELDFTDQECANYIRNRILSGDPLMIARFGSVELANMLEYEYQYFQKKKNSWIDRLYHYAHNKKTPYYNWNEKQSLKYNAGFFPIDMTSISQFYELMIDSTKELDILGSWVKGENQLRKYFPTAKICRLGDLEPYFQLNAWSSALEGKKVLVIHPFEDSIRTQYHNSREKLFENPSVLPKFTLHTIKAVQTIGGISSDFDSWFDALEFMKKKIESTDFDIALIGCGAYGFPLAAFVKKMGKQAIHLGGATQLMFGIRGKRWDEDPRYDQFINAYWKRPFSSEKPVTASIIEGACYW